MWACLPSVEGDTGELQGATPNTLVLQISVCRLGSGGMAPITVYLPFLLTTRGWEGESEVDVRGSQPAVANAWSPAQ